MPTSGVYGLTEIEEIVEHAQKAGLDAMRCPRDGARLVYDILTFQQVERDKKGRGVKRGDFMDVQTISIACPECSTMAGGVSVT